jgi:hypothetical protein
MKRNTAILDRLVDPVARTLELRADPKLQARMDKLARECNEGLLTPDVREEYETSIRFGNFIAILQPKARLILKRHATVR